MKPAPFEYHRPDSVEEAISLLASHGYDAKPLAGGQSLIPAMNFRLAQPAVLVDLNGVSELFGIEAIDGAEGEHIVIRAMTRQRQVERSAEVARITPLLAETLPFVAHPQIRNRGTLGGSIAHADPAAEVPAVMVALDAQFRVQGPNGTRVIPADEFFIGLFTTALEPDELLTHVEVAAPAPGSASAFEEISRRHGDFALAGVAAVLTLDDEGRCAGARISLLSVGDGPALAQRAAAALVGSDIGEAAVRAAADAAASHDVDPPADIHASAAYRRRLVEVLVRRAVTRAADRARSGRER